MEMTLRIASCSLILCALLVVLITRDGGARKIAITSGGVIELKEASNELQNFATDGHVLTKINNKHAKKDEEEEDDESDDEDEDDDKENQRKMKGRHHNQMAPELNVFFTPNDLKIGKKMSIYFAQKNLSTSPKFLPRQESEKIPFSSKHLPSLLKNFSFPKHSPQAKAMKYTLKQCEYEPMKGETKFCATSLESLLDFVHEIFGPNSQFEVLSTTHLTNSSFPLQSYTISQVKKISVPKVLGCHPMPYPYAVFYCHSQHSDTSLFVVLVDGENGARVEAPAICHMDTSKWNRDHVAFDVLKVQPGTSPVCHFFPFDNFVWVPSSF